LASTAQARASDSPKHRKRVMGADGVDLKQMLEKERAEK
jgi:hypothetical protein